MFSKYDVYTTVQSMYCYAFMSVVLKIYGSSTLLLYK